MSQLSLKTKILLLAGFMSVLSVLIGGTGYWYSQTTSHEFQTVVNEDVPKIRSLNRILLAFRLARIELLHLTMPGNSPEFYERAIKAVDESWAQIHKEEEKYATFHLEEAEKSAYEEFDGALEGTKQEFDKAVALFKANSNEDSAEQKAMRKVVLHDLAEKGVKLRDATKKLVDLQSAEIEEDTEVALKASSRGTQISAALTFFGCLAGLIVAYLFSTKISQQINNIINSISESSNQVSSASAQIATSSEELSQAAAEQASSLQETASSLEQINAMIAKSSESAANTEERSAESQNKANEGRQAVEQMLASMEDISQSNAAIMQQVNASNQEMTEIVRVIQEIGNKTKVINEIVFQTKLLSFNASVEAARAGEHGKGFAVVAEEVGNLAQMSGNAAKEITEMLDSSIGKVEQIVVNTKSRVETLVEQGKHKVDSGVNVARQCSTVLEEIVENVVKVSSLAQEISIASKEQAQGVGNINQAMSQLDGVTQQNSATSEEAASSAEELSAQAASLKSAVDELVMTVQGRTSHATLAVTKSAPLARANNVIKLKSPVKKAKAKTNMVTKAASGELAPSRNDDGFQDV